MKKINFLATDGVCLNGILYEVPTKTEDIILAVHGMASNCFKLMWLIKKKLIIFVLIIEEAN